MFPTFCSSNPFSLNSKFLRTFFLAFERRVARVGVLALSRPNYYFSNKVKIPVFHWSNVAFQTLDTVISRRTALIKEMLYLTRVSEIEFEYSTSGTLSKAERNFVHSIITSNYLSHHAPKYKKKKTSSIVRKRVRPCMYSVRQMPLNPLGVLTTRRS